MTNSGKITKYWKDFEKILMVLAQYIFWIFVWFVVMAVLFYAICWWIGVDYSWLLALIAGTIVAFVWMIKRKRCKT